MKISDLVIFKAVVDAGGVTRAAERLRRVQSNVTTRLRQLEEKLDTQLFIRQGKKLHLSQAGQTLLPYADQLLALAEEARSAVQADRPRGQLLLGAMESTAAVRLPEPLVAYGKLHPQVSLGLRTGNPQQLAAWVLSGEIHAALVTEPVVDGPFDMVSVYAEELVIVARSDHPKVGKGAALPAAIVAFEKGCPHRKRLEDWYAQRSGMPSRIVEITSYHAMLGCVAAGMGISLLPRSVLSTFPNAHVLSVHPLPRGLDRAKTMLIWRKGAMSPKIRALIDVLKQKPVQP
jgi:DNA-binding transcriptional LysR family regulator